MSYTVERITAENYSRFEDMVYFRENGVWREPSMALISEQMQRQLDTLDFFVYAVMVEDRFVGWISLCYISKIGSRWNGHGHVYVDELWVAPDYRNRGFSKALLQKADELKSVYQASGIRLYVNVNNPVAQSLYQSCGYIPDGQAIFMEKAE